MAGTTSSRETILAKIRRALAQPVPLPFPKQDAGGELYPASTEDLTVTFAQEFTRLLGRFAYCEDDADLAHQLGQLTREKQWKEVFCVEPEIRKLLSPDNGLSFSTLPLEQADLSITSCEALVARTGSMVLSARTGGRTTSVYAPVHVCIARTSQLVFDVKDALQLMKSKYPDGLPSQVSFATGPSRTADIEKTLVVGVHGPKEVYCFLLEDL
jgi:L-lactate dehydrogenase complex protein LldG